jgi:CubicO group peptidase (beta-lactamase class C family)
MAPMDPVIDPIAARLDACAARFVVDQRVPGVAVGVVRDGALVWTSTLGFADRASARKIEKNTLFRIASISKTFTATALLQLRDEGRLRLDDPLVDHVPEARAIRDAYGPIEDVTLRRLLTHTSGLQGDAPVDDPWTWELQTHDKMLSRLDEVSVFAAPETGWRYSNIGYELLGVVVSRVSGEPFTDYVQRCVIDVAGLTSTAYFPSGEVAARCATGYGPRLYEDDLTPTKPYDSSTMLADGGLWSTLEDLARWLTVQSRTSDDDHRGDGDRVLDGKTLREMQRPGVLADWSYGQGLGWASRRIGEDAWVSHTGGLFGFRSMVLFRPEDKLGVIAMTNGSSRLPFAIDIASTVLESCRVLAPSVPAAPPVPTPDAWRELLGLYREDTYGLSFRVEVRDAALALVDESDPSHPPRLIATEDPLVWEMSGGELIGERVRFIRGRSGAIAGLNAAGAPARKLVPAQD